jgi:hypothetical protein
MQRTLGSIASLNEGNYHVSPQHDAARSAR